MTLKAVSLALVSMVAAAPLLHAHTVWENRSSLFGSGANSLSSVAFGSGRFVLVGNSSSVYYTSLNGTTAWTAEALPGGFTPMGVKYGAGLFVMVGTGGTIYTSPTGVAGSWTARISGLARNLLSVRYLNNRFVVGADHYEDAINSLNSYTEVLTSPDGITWTSYKYLASGVTLAGEGYDITDIAFKPGAAGAGIWVLGTNRTNTCLYANESLSVLTRVAVIAVGGDQRVTYGGGAFVITSAVSGIGKLWVSTTGTSWTQAALPTGVTVADLTGVAHDGTRFVAVGSSVSGGVPAVPAVVHSTDGVNWTRATTVPATTNELLFAHYVNGLWLAGGEARTLFTSGSFIPPTPTVTTAAVTVKSSQGATLNGTLNARGLPREVSFQYGLTTALGTTVAAQPTPISTIVDTAFTASLTGLAAHTRYYYRAHASGSGHTIQGAILNFTTDNTPPVAVPDAFQVAPGSAVVLDVLTNDAAVEPDGDSASVLSFTQPAAGGGKVAKVGANLVFTAPVPFAGGSFSYVVSDGFGGKATGNVVITAGTCEIDPASAQLMWQATTYPIAVDASGGWSVNEALTWVTVTPATGSGDGTVNVTVTANAAKNSRGGVIKIGGKEHAITQAGVPLPVLTQPDPIPPAMVGCPFTLTVPTTNLPVKYTVAKMPPGLAVSGVTGVISGTPTKAGLYQVTVKAGNPGGSSVETLTIPIDVRALPDGSLGVFQGLVARSDSVNGGLGSRIEMTTTASGAFSGKLITGGASLAFKGALVTDATLVDPDAPRAVATITRRGLAPLKIDLTLNLALNTLSGTVSDGDGDDHTAAASAWRRIWTSTTPKATAYKALHTFSLAQPNSSALLPQGFGYGSFTPAEKTGDLTVAGKLADHSSFTTGTFVGPQGQVLIYQSLYVNKGTFIGSLGVTPGAIPAENALTEGPALTWSKPAPAATSTDTVYKEGFAAASLTATGGGYPALAPGAIVLGLPEEPNNANLLFELGAIEFNLTFALFNPTDTGLTNKWTVPSDANKVWLTTLNTATGAFSGNFTIPNPTAALVRKANYQGIIARDGTATGINALGYTLLSDLPGANQALAKAPKRSYRVRLRAAP